LIQKSDPFFRRFSLALGIVDLKQEIIFGLVEGRGRMTGSLP